MLAYPIKVSADGGGFMVSFPDVPEALTSGPTKVAAIANARDALETAMDFYFEDCRTVPLPSAPKRGQILVSLPTSISAKVLLLNTMIEEGVTASELARRLHTTRQTVQRIVQLRHPTKIDTIADALGAMGKRLRLAVS
jgi:antitoxin HicB